jgi:hypothetical protein
MPAMTGRYRTQQLGLPHHVKTATRIWRSTDLKGPLPKETVKALFRS